MLDIVLTYLEEATDIARIMGELGYGYTNDVTHCKDVLSLFFPLIEKIVSKIISTIVCIHTKLVDAHGMHGKFYSSLFSSSTTNYSRLTSSNIDVLFYSIKELVSLL